MPPPDRAGILISLMRKMSLNPDPDSIVKLVSGAMRKAYGPWAVILLSVRNMPRGHYVVTRLIDDDGSERIGDTDPWYGDPNLPPQQGGFLGNIVRDQAPALVRNAEPGKDPVLGDALLPYHSFIAVPVYESGDVVNWMILGHREPEGFRDIDLEWGIMRANLVGAMISHQTANRRLREATRRIQQEVDNIAALQRALLPPKPKPDWALDIATYWNTYDRAGGDYYDFFTLPSADSTEKLLIFIADASGHGPSAAVVVAMLHIILRSLSETAQPSLILEEINTRLFEQRISNMFVTAWVGIYNPADETLDYASAGHMPPLIRDGAGAPRYLESSSGIPLGVEDRVGADDRSVTPGQDATLVLYTDGITEARAPDKEQFGIDRLIQALASATGNAQSVCDHLMDAVDIHEAGTRPDDDKCLLVVRRCP